MSKKYILMILIIALMLPITHAQKDANKVFLVKLDVFKNDTVSLKENTIIDGIPSTFPTSETGYKIKIFSSNGKEILNENIGISFTLILDPVGAIRLNSTRVTIKLPYFPDARLIKLYHLDKEILSLSVNQATTTTLPAKQPVKSNTTWLVMLLGIILVASVVFMLLKAKSETYENERNF